VPGQEHPRTIRWIRQVDVVTERDISDQAHVRVGRLDQGSAGAVIDEERKAVARRQ